MNGVNGALPDPRHRVWYFPVVAAGGEVVGWVWGDHGRAEVGWQPRSARSAGVVDQERAWEARVGDAGERGVWPLAFLGEASREVDAGRVVGAGGLEVVHRLARAVEESDDRRLLAELSPRDAAEWRELREAYEALGEEDRDVRWGGGERTENGAIQIPYPMYGKPLWRVVGALFELGAVTPEHRWTEWPWPEPPADGHLAPADAVRAATALVRAERMSEGGVDKALRNGLFDAIVVSLLTWHEPNYRMIGRICAE